MSDKNKKIQKMRKMRSRCGNRNSGGVVRSMLLVVATLMVASSFRSSLVLIMAVDRNKFRTCEQTSFCRRHRKGASSRLFDYAVVKSSIQFVPPQISAVAEEVQQAEAGDASNSGWRSWIKTAWGSGSASTRSNSGGYFRGTDAVLKARLVNKAAEQSSTTAPDAPEQLALTLHFHDDGVARVRITEDVETDNEEARAAERWTSDELVLNVEEMVASPKVELIAADGDDDGKALQLLDTFLRQLGVEKDQLEKERFNIAILKYYSGSDEKQAYFLVLRLEPSFGVYLWRGEDEHDSRRPATGPPIIALDSLYFEVRRSRQDCISQRYAADEDNEEQEDSDEEDTPPEEEKEEDPHHGKEVVGYWEDGLAIYADGTREERKEVKADTHRRLTHDDVDLDLSDMWEESFGDHGDTKPYGPMSVGLTASFPRSSHVYGIPEHAAAASLQTTMGEGAHFSEPYRLYNLDVFEYELDETMALYGHIPLLVSHSAKVGTAGVFYFNPSETFVDVEREPGVDAKNDVMTTTKSHWMSESGILDVFLLPGHVDETHQLYHQYGHLTGRTALPPMFSLGYHQCRWNYRDEADVAYVHGKFEELNYPYDVLWLDIEHTDGKRYFTWDSHAFPTPADMQKKLSDQGRKMVTIVDPHVKRDNGYYVHKEATSKGLYVKDKEGSKDYDGWCWPGSSSYPDFLDPQVREWWASLFDYDKYKGSTPSLYTWNDMNEPSVFNGPEVSMSKDLRNLEGIEHREWHNLYGLAFHRATAEGLQKRNKPDENVRPFVLSRSFFASTQKYGAIWTGDNEAQWSHLVMAAPMLLSMNAAALSFVGADVGGFFGDPDWELMVRWMQAGAYTPFFRGHAHHDSKRREPWVYDENNQPGDGKTTDRLRRAAMARYALLPYWYTLFYQAHTTGMPILRMMWMQYPTVTELFDVDDEYLVGSDLLVKPVTAAGATQTTVQFPTRHCWYDVDTNQLVSPSAGATPGKPVAAVKESTRKADLDKIPVYQRGGSIVARKLRLRRSSALMIADPYTLYVALDDDESTPPSQEDVGVGTAFGTLYMDDEESFDFERHLAFGVAHFSANLSKGYIANRVELGQGWKASSTTAAAAHMAGRQREIERIVVMGLTRKPAGIAHSGKKVDFTYDAATKVLVIRQPRVSALEEWTLQVSFG